MDKIPASLGKVYFGKNIYEAHYYCIFYLFGMYP